MIKSRLVLYFLVLLLVLPINISQVFAQQAPNNPLDATTSKPGINIIGDSLTARAQQEIQKALPNASIDPAVSRQWSGGISALQNIIAEGNLAPVVVFALGTNGAADDAGIDQVIQLTGDSRVVFMTIYGTTQFAQENSTRHNAVIKNALTRYPGRVIIADWYSIASPHPEWFAGDTDGVHPSGEGIQAFARTITSAIGANPLLNSQVGTSSNGSVKSNMLCVKVGDPSTEKPAICNQATSTSILTYGQGAPGNFTYYCQGNPQWDQKGNACSIGQIGCGPTSLAMIFSYFGDTITPDLMYKTYADNGMINCAVGSFPGSVNAWVAKQPGYEVGPNIGSGALNATEAKKYIDAGWLILASSDNFIGQSGKSFGHIFVVQDVDPAAGTFILRDPENCNYGTGEEFTRNITQPILGGKVPSWKYAYPIRKNATQPQPQGVNQNAF